MKSHQTGYATGGPAPGEELRLRAADVGERVRTGLQALLDALFDPGVGPQRVADRLGRGVPMASRLLKALGAGDPLALLYHVPGPDPLRHFVRAAARQGAEASLARDAKAAIDEFAELVRDSGDRSGLNAMLAAWVPEARRTFELRRRQAAWRALSELKGSLCATDLVTMLLHPSQDGARLDLAVLLGRFGLRRLRPGVRVPFSTQRLSAEDVPRRPTNLDGAPVAASIDGVRLDEFCHAPPAPIESTIVSDRVLHVLGESGFGPRAGVDIVVGEVNRSEFPLPADEPDERRFFFHCPSVPARVMVFDLFVHEDVFVDPRPELVVTDITGSGLARPTEATRAVDVIEVFEEVEEIWPGPALRVPELPRYRELLEHVHGKLDWSMERMRGYRVRMEYPVPGMQVSLVLPLR